MQINTRHIPSPCFVLDEARLRKNLQLIDRVQQEAGVKIILAFKGFAMWSAFPLVKEYLSGATASSLNEARLCFEEMGTKAHTYTPAYLPQEFEEVLEYSSHVVFNSLSQYHQFIHQVNSHPTPISIGLRVNPGYSDVSTELYNPASPTSRLGIGPEALKNGLPEGVEGLHFHVLCESDSYALEEVLNHFEQKFGHLLPQLKWINMGGGHLMTRHDYDLGHLIGLLKNFREKHNVEVILEPGSAIAWQTGDLMSTVLDIVEEGGVKTALLDVSFTCHMPDTLEMPYKPEVAGAEAKAVHGKHQYRLGGTSCLAGDFLTEYSFEKELKIGDKLVLKDMMHYTMVKTTTFNGVAHPSIGILKEDGAFELLRTFGYEDYKGRLS